MLSGCFCFRESETKKESETYSASEIKAPSSSVPHESLSEKASVTETATEITEPITFPKHEYSSFKDTAFLGNSRFVSLKDYGLAPNVYPVVGLDVRTVFSKHVTDSDVIVIDELDGRSFDKVILMFGDNECGWPNRDYFVKKYENVIDAVKEKQPDARIYLHAIIPVSKTVSEKNDCGCNNSTIQELNIRIKQLAEDCGVDYIDVPSFMLDREGNLVDEAASDGIHFNKKYSSAWMAYIEELLFE